MEYEQSNGLDTGVYLYTWAEAFKSPLEVPSDSGNVISAAKSNPSGKYPVMKNLVTDELIFDNVFIFWGALKYY